MYYRQAGSGKGGVMQTTIKFGEIVMEAGQDLATLTVILNVGAYSAKVPITISIKDAERLAEAERNLKSLLGEKSGE